MDENTIIQSAKLVFAAIGGLIMHLLGGSDELIGLFGALIATDFVFGVLKGLKTSTFRSTIMRWGAVNKALEAIVIIVFNQFDSAIHLDIFRNGAVIWFCLCEGTSLVENLIALGVPCPDGLGKALGKLKSGISISFVDVLYKILDEKMLYEKLHIKKGEDDIDHQS